MLKLARVLEPVTGGERLFAIKRLLLGITVMFLENWLVIAGGDCHGLLKLALLNHTCLEGCNLDGSSSCSDLIKRHRGVLQNLFSKFR